MPNEWDAPEILDVSMNVPWANAIGKELFSVWQLVTLMDAPLAEKA
jgi:hypothetical protein